MWKSCSLPVIVFDEFHQLLLRVRLSRDDHRLVDEGFIKVNFVELQLQSLSNLSDRTETFDPSSTVIDLQQSGHFRAFAGKVSNLQYLDRETTSKSFKLMFF